MNNPLKPALLTIVFASSVLLLSAQNKAQTLVAKYPVDSKLSLSNLEEYGLDVKKRLNKPGTKLLIEHIKSFFLPQLETLAQAYPEKLSSTLMWVNTALSDMYMDRKEVIKTGELFLRLSEQYPKFYPAEEKLEVFFNLTISYRRASKFDKCNYYAALSFDLLDSEKGSISREGYFRGRLFCVLAGMEFKKRRIDEAKRMIDQAKPYCRSPKSDCYLFYRLKLAKYYERIGQRKKAIRLTKALLNRAEQTPANYSEWDKTVISEKLAHLCYYDGQLERAIGYFKDVIKNKKKYSLNFTSDVGLLNNIANSYTWLGEYQKSKAYLTRVLDKLGYNPMNPFPFDDQDQDKLWTLLLTLHYYAQNEQFHYADGGSVDNLHIAYDFQLQYLDLLEHMSKNLSPNSSRYFIDRVYFMYEEALYVCYKLYEETQNKKYLEEAFEIAGRAKAMHVKEAAQNTAAEELFPASLLQRRYDLRKRYVDLENRLYESQERQADASALGDSVLSAKNDYYRFIDSLESALPRLQQMWDIPKPPALQTVQARLKQDKRAMVQYLIGYQYVFLFLLDGENITLYNTKIPKGLAEQVNTMRDALYEWALKPSDTSVQSYAQSAHWLYEKLLAPVDSLLPFRLLIVPDNCVAYLPFDVLLKATPEPGVPFQEYPYLIQDHQISYAYSPYDFVRAPKTSQHKKSAILGFAPSFNDGPASFRTVAERRREFGPLLANEQEVEQIASFFSTRTFAAEAATKEAFLDNAPGYQVLHLATHAKANDKSGEYSYLCFSEPPGDTTKSNRLYARELYLTDLPADMVVLSACETGLGELSKGEGVISLSQAFSRAGAQSLITTLWRVSDQASAQLMKSFYEQLHEGVTKDAALRNAKLKYLNEASARNAHPFFWAGYVAQGDMAPLSLSSGYFMWWICLFLLGLFVILFWRIRSKRRQAHAKN